MVNPQIAATATNRSGTIHHIHAVEDVCPVCEQPISSDRAKEITERLQARELAQSAALTARMRETFETEKLDALNRAELDAEQKIIEAREEARLAAEIHSKAHVETAELARAAAEQALRTETAKAGAEKTSLEAANTALQNQVQNAQRESLAAIEAVKVEAAAEKDAIRLEATRIATDASASRLAELEAQKATAEAEAKVQIDAAEQAKAEAEAAMAIAEAAAKSLQESHDATLNKRLQELREALEADKITALNAEKSATFEDRQKLANKVEDLQRALEKKTAEELGEGAELDLFEALKGEFGGDRIVRVTKGQQGADILHTVIHNGQECGIVIYDSKNHNAWRNDFVTKLRSDQLSAQADHAVLSSSRFPAGARQLHIQDGVVIACPARVVALIQLIRAHLVQSHTLRMSNAERTDKTAALYSFITSQQCTDSFARLDELAESLLDIQRKEVKAHENVWKQQGLAIRGAMKVQVELRNQIDSIIGTASAPKVLP